MPSTAEAAAALLAQQSPEDAAMVVAVDTEEALQAAVAEPPPVVPSSPEAVAPPPAPETAQPHYEEPPPGFSLGEPEPEWLTELLEDDPVDIDDEPPPSAAVVAEPAEDDEYVDPEVAALRRQLAAERKRAEHYEKQHAKSSQKAWAKEAEKYYPLADTTSITATSRRAFMREAKAQHERLKPQFARFQEAEKARLRAEAAEQWGAPVQGGQIPSAAADLDARVAAARKTGSLAKVFKEMLLPGGGR